ncbi:MAG: hypothetical protein LBU22_00800 [Dysgonamonadaceae bacterium]|jgi:hypothetical protein|nr:hypothetical protein [Dysgonamonadaceae bacterium]
MKQIFNIIFIAVLPWLFVSCKEGDNPASERFTVRPFDPVAVQKTNKMKLYVHYMPWFETPETNNGKWGWHWTMNNKNPERISDGKREIASWYYPLIGPYASGDPDVLEYHLLLMKYAGIDGVWVDWYGLQQKNDLPGIAKNTDVLFKAIEKVGLEFAIVYEDRFLDDTKAEMIRLAQADMAYLQSNYFTKDYYVKFNGKPLLLIFGPAKLQEKSDWEKVFSGMTTQPAFFTLHDHFHTASTTAAGEYMWVDAQSPEDKYQRATAVPGYIGAAYPGYRDFYKEGGDGNGYNIHWDYNNGSLFGILLELGKTKGQDCMQLITWNDFGEGTMIEPTVEFGYKFLTVNQQFAGVAYSEKELTLIKKLYDVRQALKERREAGKKLDQIFYYLVSLQYNKAEELMKEMENN